MVSPFALVVCRIGGVRRWARSSLAQNPLIEQDVNRFALAIGALPMLETARIGGDAWFL
jgi:hypothetical protein